MILHRNHGISYWSRVLDQTLWCTLEYMAYHVYHTEAIILGGRLFGDGDRILYCYTREFGMLFAHAKSIREIRSRLRYALQTFAYAEVDLIRGKHGWKLISARPVDSFGHLWSHRQKRHVVAQHTHLLRRLIQGEEEHRALFDDLLNGLYFLGTIEESEELRAAELLLVIRLLERLGYWETEQSDEILFTADSWTKETLEHARGERARLLVGVNRALAASQL